MAEELTKFNDFTYESQLSEDLVSKNSVLHAFDDYTDAMGFESEFEGVEGLNVLPSGIRTKKKKYADTAAGIWMGVDSDGKAKINIGDSTSYVKWDGATLNIAGSVTVGGSFTAATITGSTITGSTLTTANSGQRVVLTTTLAEFYNSSNTLVAITYADTNAYWISGQQATSNIYIDSGASGNTAFLFGGTITALFNATTFYPTVSGVSLGSPGFNWLNVYNNGEHVYHGMTMPVVYFGLVESGSIVNDNNVPFSINHLSLGRYEVVHSLGHTTYGVHLTPRDSTGTHAKAITIESYDGNSFILRISNLTPTLIDADFYFTVYEYPQ